jgi:hypothetical protein
VGRRERRVGARGVTNENSVNIEIEIQPTAGQAGCRREPIFLVSGRIANKTLVNKMNQMVFSTSHRRFSFP